MPICDYVKCCDVEVQKLKKITCGTCQREAMLLQGKWRCARERFLAGKPNFNQDMEQRSRATYAGEAAPGGVGRQPNLQGRPHNGSGDSFFGGDGLFLRL